MSRPDKPDDLTPAERERFARLPREIPPPAQLEDRVVSAVAANRHHGNTVRGGGAGAARKPLIRIPVAVAAGIVIALAFWLGRETAAPRTLEPTFALLLYEGGVFDPQTPANYPGRYDDYNTWIATLTARNRFVTGLQFDSAAVHLTAPGRDAPTERTEFLGSMFLIAAEDLETAIQIGEEIPHLRYGGRVTVRELVPIAPPTTPGGE